MRPGFGRGMGLGCERDEGEGRGGRVPIPFLISSGKEQSHRHQRVGRCPVIRGICTSAGED
jgi:hypothetical protein